MNWATILYLSTVSDKLGQISIASFAVSLVATSIGVAILASGNADDDDDDEVVFFGKRMLKTFIPVLLVSILFNVFLPDQKTVLAMVAADGIQELAQSDDVQRVASKSLTLLERYIDERTNQPDE